MAGRAIGAKQAPVEGRVAMTGNALFRRTFEYIIHVTLGAVDLQVGTSEREGRLGVVESGWLPSFRSVTQGAILTKLAIVLVILGMAGVAVLRSVFKEGGGVAILAGDGGMFAH